MYEIIRTGWPCMVFDFTWGKAGWILDQPEQDSFSNMAKAKSDLDPDEAPTSHVGFMYFKIEESH